MRLDDPPSVLIASASAYERGRLARELGRTRWTLHPVADAVEAGRICAATLRLPVLVIDSGLLEAGAQHAQWHALRTCHPALGAVVRSLIPRGALWRSDANTFRVHPDDLDGLCRAVGLLDSGLAAEAPAS